LSIALLIAYTAGKTRGFSPENWHHKLEDLTLETVKEQQKLWVEVSNSK
jgi:hypothetical protein